MARVALPKPEQVTDPAVEGTSTHGCRMRGTGSAFTSGGARLSTSRTRGPHARQLADALR